MSLKKKIISAALAFTMIFSGAVSMTGCSDASYVATVEGETVPAGVYILYCGSAYGTAVNTLKEEQPDLDTTADGFSYYDQTVSGMSFGEFVKQEAMDNCKRYVQVNKLFDELGLEFTAEEEETIASNLDNEWGFEVGSYASLLGATELQKYDTMGDYYQSLGVSQSSFKNVYMTAYKSSKIFDYYYAEGGVEEVPQSEIESWLGENYTVARYISISLKDSDNNLIEDEAELQKLEDLANGYKAQLDEGKGFAEVMAQYEAYLKAKSAEADTETAPDESSENTSEAEGEDVSDETSEEVTEETSDEAEEISAEETEATSAEEAEETSAEENGEETTEATTEADESAEEETKTDSDYNTVFSKKSTSPSAEFVENLFSMDFNTAQVYKADTYYYVVVRIDIVKEGSYVEDYRTTALDALKGDELEDRFEEAYNQFAIEENTGIPDYAATAQEAYNALNTVSMFSYYLQMFGY